MVFDSLLCSVTDTRPPEEGYEAILGTYVADILCYRGVDGRHNQKVTHDVPWRSDHISLRGGQSYQAMYLVKEIRSLKQKYNSQSHLGFCGATNLRGRCGRLQNYIVNPADLKLLMRNFRNQLRRQGLSIQKCYNFRYPST